MGFHETSKKSWGRFFFGFSAQTFKFDCKIPETFDMRELPQQGVSRQALHVDQRTIRSQKGGGSPPSDALVDVPYQLRTSQFSTLLQQLLDVRQASTLTS